MYCTQTMKKRTEKMEFQRNFKWATWYIYSLKKYKFFVFTCYLYSEA